MSVVLKLFNLKLFKTEMAALFVLLAATSLSSLTTIKSNWDGKTCVNFNRVFFLSCSLLPFFSSEKQIFV